MKIDLEQLQFIDDNLRAMVSEAEAALGVEFIITSLYRIDDTGVHGQLPLRGIDIRCRDRGLAKAITNHVNDRWTYDPERPVFACAIAHGEGANFHIHFQTHPNTRRNLQQ